MTLSDRERKLLMPLVPAAMAMVFLRFVVFSDPTPVASANVDTIAMAQQRVTRLRKAAAMLAARETIVKQTASDLADRERGIIQADTAAQAQATLLEVARRLGKVEQIDVRGGDFGAPKSFGDYGLVYATVTFDCRIEQLVNFLAGLSHQPELVVPSEERITSNNNKDKLMNVRMVLAGVVSRKLVPEKKGLGAL